MTVVPNTFKGFGVTLKQIFKKPITQQYPEQKSPVYPRFRAAWRPWYRAIRPAAPKINGGTRLEP